MSKSIDKSGHINPLCKNVNESDVSKHTILCRAKTLKDPIITLAANPESVLQGIDICYKLSANNQSLFFESHFNQIIIKHLHGSHAVNWRSFSPPFNHTESLDWYYSCTKVISSNSDSHSSWYKHIKCKFMFACSSWLPCSL